MLKFILLNSPLRPYLDDIKYGGTKPIPKPIPEVKGQNEGTKLLLSLVLELVWSLHFFMSSKYGLKKESDYLLFVVPEIGKM